MTAGRARRSMPVVVDSVQVVADSPLLRSVDRSSLDGLGSELEWIILDEQEVLRFDGERGDALYFVASGRLEILQAARERGRATDDDAQVLTTLAAGDALGEMRALTGSQGLAAVRGVTASRLVRLAKDRLDWYLATHPDVAENLHAVFAPRFYRNEMLQVLLNMFGNLTDEVLADIEHRLTWRHVAREEALFRQGESTDELFVLISGRLQELTKDNAGGDRVVNEIGHGGTVGEMGVLTDEIQTTSVVAVRNSVLLQFSRANFREMAIRYPVLNEWLARLLSRKLRGVIQETPTEHLTTNILLIPASDGALGEILRTTLFIDFETGRMLPRFQHTR